MDKIHLMLEIIMCTLGLTINLILLALKENHKIAKIKK